MTSRLGRRLKIEPLGGLGLCGAWVIGLLALGLFVVEVLGFQFQPMDLDVRFPLGYLLGYYAISGAQAFFFGSLALASVLAVLIGLTLTVFDYARRAFKAIVAGIRFVREYGVDHTVGLSLPLSLVIPAFLGFIQLTGLHSLGFWLAAALPIGAACVACTASWRALHRRLGRVGAAMAIGGVATVLGVTAFEALGPHLPPEMSRLRPGWGPYLAVVTAVGVLVGSWMAGMQIRRRLTSTEQEPSPEPAPDPAPAPPLPPPPRQSRPLPSAVRYPTLPGPDHWSPTPVVGWRAWSWNGSALRGYWAEWPTSLMEARCEACQEVPGEDGCGVYAVKARSDVPRAFLIARGVPGVVVGRVELEGLVIEHERGYRGATARMVELWVPADLETPIQHRYLDVTVHVERRMLG